VWCGSDADPGVCSASSDSRTERVRDSTCGACDADMVRGVAATPIHVFVAAGPRACVVVPAAPPTPIQVCFSTSGSETTCVWWCGGSGGMWRYLSVG
jgi:hypothetical protein